jgi:DUF971 family protein
MGSPVPVEINHIRGEKRVRVTWDDSHVGNYTEEYLRGYCPCALCQGHGGTPGKKFLSVPDAKLLAIQPVGNYAIGFQWQDGHNTGIYHFEYLRSLCPCDQCKPQASR